MPRRRIRASSRCAARAARRALRRSRRSCRAELLGTETTPLRWFQTCLVTHTSSTDQVATTVLPTLLSTIGKASQDPASVHSNATMAWMIVSDMMRTARTADLRTGSGIRRRPAGSSTHSCWRGIFAPPAAEFAVVAGADDTAPRRCSVFKALNSPPLSDFRVAARHAPFLRGRIGPSCLANPCPALSARWNAHGAPGP